MRFNLLLLLLACIGCECGGSGDDDAGADGAADVGDDSTFDVGEDVSTDLSADVNGDVSTDASSDSGSDASSDSGSDADLDASTGDCIEQPDFTPCNVVTDPDRDYDICVAGSCVSPGCGNATCAPPGPSFVFADTGQRGCYDTSASIACPGASCAAFCEQDAEHGWDVTNPMSARTLLLSSWRFENHRDSRHRGW